MGSIPTNFWYMKKKRPGTNLERLLHIWPYKPMGEPAHKHPKKYGHRSK